MSLDEQQIKTPLDRAKSKIAKMMSDEVVPEALEANETIDDLTTDINKSFELEGENAFSTQELIAICRDAAPLRKDYLATGKSASHAYSETAFSKLMRRATLDTKNETYTKLAKVYLIGTGEEFPKA